MACGHDKTYRARSALEPSRKVWIRGRSTLFRHLPTDAADLQQGGDAFFKAEVSHFVFKAQHKLPLMEGEKSTSTFDKPLMRRVYKGILGRKNRPFFIQISLLTVNEGASFGIAKSC